MVSVPADVLVSDALVVVVYEVDVDSDGRLVDSVCVVVRRVVRPSPPRPGKFTAPLLPGSVDAIVPPVVREVAVAPGWLPMLKLVVVSAFVFVIATGTVVVSPGAPTVVEVPVVAPSCTTS